MKSQTQSQTQESQSHFPFAVTKIAVAQICQSVGFKSAQNSALQTITDVATRYLQALASSAAVSANSTGRTQSNLLDIIIALEHLHSIKGFHGASNVNQKLYKSTPLLDIIKFVKYSDEIPFVKPLPRRCFEEKQQFVVSPTVMERGKDGRNYIPRWLPGIPEMGGKSIEMKGITRLGGNGGGEEGCLVGEKMGVEEREGKIVRELPVKRGRVKFKMGVGVGEVKKGRGMGFGVDLRNGVCRGGKRVSVQIWSGDEDKNKKKKKKISSSKRPSR